MKITEQNLTELGKLLDPTGVIKQTREELLAAFKKIVEMVQKMKEENAGQLDRIISTFGSLENKLETDTSKILTKAERIIAAELESLLRRFSAEQKKIDDKLTAVENGKDADSVQIVQDVLAQIRLPEYKEVILDDAEKLRDKLETLKGDERIDKSAIKGLEEFEKLNQKNLFGGFNYSSVDIHIIDDETPLGTINGVNKTFTIAHPPSPVVSLKVFLGGQRLRKTEDYTFSGQTIIFNTAPPTDSILLVDYRI